MGLAKALGWFKHIHEEEEEEVLYSNAIGLSALEHIHATRHAICKHTCTTAGSFSVLQYS